MSVAAGVTAPATRGRAARVPWRLVALATAVALLALTPLFFVVGEAVHVGAAEAAQLLLRARVGHLLANTAKLVAASTVLCGVIGTAAAWLVERTTLPGRKVFAALLAAPLAVPAFVNSFGWVSLTPAVQGFAGATLIVTLSYYPLVYLPVAAALRGTDPAVEETARSLGLGPWRVFARVVLPQLRPALGGGMLIVALHLLTEFGAFQMLRFDTFTTAIYSEYRASFDGPAADMLACVLVVICVVLLVAEVRMRGNARVARLGPGASRPVRTTPMRGATPGALLGLVVLLGAALGVPIGSFVHWLVIGASAAFPVGSLLAAAGTSLGLGLAAAVVTTLVALPVALLAVRHRGVATTMLERSTYLTHALPGIVIALALIFVAITFAQPLYQSVPLLVAAYVILFLPLAMVSVRAALAQAQPELVEAARALGCRPATALRRVTLPLIAPGLGAAAALVFLLVTTELTATLLLAPIGTQTLATAVWSHTGSLSYAAAAPYALLIVIISAPATYLLASGGRRTEAL